MAPNPFRPGTSREQIESPEHRDYAGAEIPATRKTQPSLIEQHGHFWDSFRKIAMGIGTAAAILIAGFTWAVNKAMDQKFDDLRRSLDPVVIRPSHEDLDRMRLDNLPRPLTLDERFAAVQDSISGLRKAIDAPNSPQSELGKKLDALDTTLRERLPRRPDKTPVPPVGPTAKQQGLQ